MRSSWSLVLLVVVVTLTSPYIVSGYVSGPLPMYERAQSQEGQLQGVATSRPLLPSVAVTPAPPVARPVQVPAQPVPRPPGTGFKPLRKFLNRNRPARGNDKHVERGGDGMIYFPTRDDRILARSKRQLFPNSHRPHHHHHHRGNQPAFNGGNGRQDFFNGQQNNFGDSFPNDNNFQWGNGNNNRPGQQVNNWGGQGGQQGNNWGGQGGQQNPWGGEDYEDVPLIFGNAGQGTSRPVNNNRPRPGGNTRPISLGNGQPQQQLFPMMTPPTVTAAPVTAPTAGTTFAGCNCPTTPEFNPVCGVDRVTYFNAGRLRCSNLCGNRVEMLHMGACIATTTAVPAAATQPSLRRQGRPPRRS